MTIKPIPKFKKHDRLTVEVMNLVGDAINALIRASGVSGQADPPRVPVVMVRVDSALANQYGGYDAVVLQGNVQLPDETSATMLDASSIGLDDPEIADAVLLNLLENGTTTHVIPDDEYLPAFPAGHATEDGRPVLLTAYRKAITDLRYSLAVHAIQATYKTAPANDADWITKVQFDACTTSGPDLSPLPDPNDAIRRVIQQPFAEATPATLAGRSLTGGSTLNRLL